MLIVILALGCSFAALLGLLAWTAELPTPIDLNLLILLVAVGQVALAAAGLQYALGQRRAVPHDPP